MALGAGLRGRHSSLDDHLKDLEKVFERLAAYGMHLKPEKCLFCRSEVPFLGNVVSKEGVRPDPKKVEAIKNLEKPKDFKSLRSSIMFLSHFRKWVRDFATYASPLTALLKDAPDKKKNKKGKPFKGFTTPEQHEAWAVLTRRLAEAPILAHPDFDKPFEVHCDASLTGLGSCSRSTTGGSMSWRTRRECSRRRS